MLPQLLIFHMAAFTCMTASLSSHLLQLVTLNKLSSSGEPAVGRCSFLPKALAAQERAQCDVYFKCTKDDTHGRELKCWLRCAQHTAGYVQNAAASGQMETLHCGTNVQKAPGGLQARMASLLFAIMSRRAWQVTAMC